MTNIYHPCAINATYVPIKTFITQSFDCLIVGSKIQNISCICTEFQESQSLYCSVFRGSHFKEPISKSCIQWPMRQQEILRLELNLRESLKAGVKRGSRLETISANSKESLLLQRMLFFFPRSAVLSVVQGKPLQRADFL